MTDHTIQTTLEQAYTTQEERVEPDVAMETGVIAVEMKEGGREGAGEDDDEVSGSQNHDSK